MTVLVKGSSTKIIWVKLLTTVAGGSMGDYVVCQGSTRKSKKVKDGKTTTQTESPDCQNEQSDIADTHLEVSTMTSDSDESSDHEAYHSGDDSDHGTSAEQFFTCVSSRSATYTCTRLSLRESRKHGLESGLDSDE